MSRYKIEGKNPKYEVFVGWDRPLQSFFGQVYDPTLEEDENPFHWVGAAPPWLPELRDIERAMADHAVIQDETLVLLIRDRDGR